MMLLVLYFTRNGMIKQQYNIRLAKACHTVVGQAKKNSFQKLSEPPT